MFWRKENDIDWESNVDGRKLMVPFLGVPFEEAIKNKEIKLGRQGKRFGLKYYEGFYPVNPYGYATILNSIIEENPKLKELQTQLQKLEQVKEQDKYSKSWQKFLSKINDEDIQPILKTWLEEINSNSLLLQKIVDEQFYRLCHWKETDTRINYRRFFTVNSLICMNVQDRNVFDRYHQFIKSLTDEGAFMGLRVDHIDGLYDPADYLERLKELTGDKTYIVVEKILEPGEALPQQWKTEGTTGYDFLALVNNLFTNKKNKEQFCKFYEELTENYQAVDEHLLEKKADILYRHMAGELDNLYRLLLAIIDKKLLFSINPEDLREVIGEFIIHCPVYRYYGNKIPLEGPDAYAVKDILSGLRNHGKASAEAIDLLQRIFLQTPDDANHEYKRKLLNFYKRCMQFTGPLMAKGLEDTLMYTYNNFVVHNEVGDSPASFGISKDEFHKAMIERQTKWPLALNTTSTHDTKRGEDIRARLNVLSDLPEEWFQHVKLWKRTTRVLKQNNIPNANEEYFIHQNLIGAYPMPGTNDGNFDERFKEYLQKALREAKINSDWAMPNEEYETTTKDFAGKLLNKKSPFWKSFELFHKKIAGFGIINSLAQLLLKFTCPGIPDVYQGCELWDLHFVDPDNRRPVNYDRRLQLLDSLESKEDKNKDEFFTMLWKKRNDSQIKIWLTQNLFKLRKQQPEFFERAEYIPLKINGQYSDFVFAFARRHLEKWLITVVPLHAAELCKYQAAADFFSIDWKDTYIVLPRKMRRRTENIFLNDEMVTAKKLIVQKLFRQLPFALLRTESEENERNAGMLLHITSLPSGL
jgi:malto-oligosyltrehalose synthase